MDTDSNFTQRKDVQYLLPTSFKRLRVLDSRRLLKLHSPWMGKEGEKWFLGVQWARVGVPSWSQDLIVSWFSFSKLPPQVLGKTNHLTQPGVQSILLPWPPQLILGMGIARPFLRGMANVLHQFWDAMNDKMYPYLERLQKRKKCCQLQL